MTKSELEGLLAHYRRLIDGMQNHVFYAQDVEGVLRRWYPPKRPLLDKEARP
jgi:hypothetical protein